MLTETVIEKAIIDRLISFLPVRMRENVLAPPDKPERITADVVSAKYPDGLLIAGYNESEGQQRYTETQLYAVDCISAGVERSEKLARFCKNTLVGFQPTGVSKIEFHDDKLIGQELGFVVRKINFRVMVAAPPLSDADIISKTADLEL
jgi:hypothetical protein